MTSTAFSAGATIPVKYSCQGQSPSIPLAWSAPPANTQTFALVMHDPDAPRAGGFDHWVVYNIPSSARGLPEDLPKTNPLPNGGIQGNNGAGNPGYLGPCPPAGPAHRYQFTLYALDTTLSLQPGATVAQVLQAVSGHVLAQGFLEGTYQRQ